MVKSIGDKGKQQIKYESLKRISINFSETCMTDLCEQLLNIIQMDNNIELMVNVEVVRKNAESATNNIKYLKGITALIGTSLY